MSDLRKLADEAAAAAPMPKPAEIVDGRVVHIDGDALCYWAAGKDDTPFGIARMVALGKITSITSLSGAEHTILHLTAQGSTKGDRRVVATIKPYQGNRSNSRRPRNWAPLRHNLETTQYPDFITKVWATREADDAFAMYAHNDARNTVLVTQDKDMRMLPGWHMDWADYTMFYVAPGTYRAVNPHNGKVYGTAWFWLQLLQGDTADNIPGLPRYFGKLCGEVTARQALEHTTTDLDAFDHIRDAYEAQYGDDWANRMVEQAVLLWLRRGKEAALDDAKAILLQPGHYAELLVEAFDRLKDRVKGQYAQAQAIGSSDLA